MHTCSNMFFSLSSQWHSDGGLSVPLSEYLQRQAMLMRSMTLQRLPSACILRLTRITPNKCISSIPTKQVGTPTPRFFWGGQTTKCVNPYLVPTWSSDSHPVYSKLEECLIRMLQLSESMIKYFTLKDWGASFRSWLSGLHVSLISRTHNSNTEQIIQRGINFFRSSLTLII